MIKIRLARKGNTHRPYYHVVVSDVRKRRDSSYIEKIGSYDPLKQDEKFTFDLERVQYWIGVGAQPTTRVYRALSILNIVPAYKVPKQTKKSQPSKKTLERLEQQKQAKAKPAANAGAANAGAADADTANAGTENVDTADAGAANA